MADMLAVQPSPLSTEGWDQSVLDYYNQLQAYKNQMEGMGFNVYDPNLSHGYFDPQSGFRINPYWEPNIGVQLVPLDYLPQENQDYYRGLMGKDPYSVYQTVMEFSDPKYGSLGRVVADPNAQYRLVDVSGGNKVVYSGSGLDALQKIQSLTPEYSKDATSQWQIQQLAPGAKDWGATPAFKPDQSSGFGKWLLGALPMVLIPGAAGAVGKALGVTGSLSAPVGAAAITGATGALAGKPIGDILLGAGLAGLGTYAGGQLAGGGSGQGTVTGGDGGLGSFDGITVVAPSSLSSSLGTVGALSNLQSDAATQRAIDQYASQQPTLQQQFDATFGGQGSGISPLTDPNFTGLTVTGVPGLGGGNLAAATGSALSNLSGVSGAQRLTDLANEPVQDTSTISDADKSEILVSAKNGNITDALGKIIKIGFPAAGAFAVLKSLLGSGASAASQTAASIPGTVDATGAITVMAPTTALDPVAASLAAGAGSAAASLSNAAQQAAQEATQAGKGPLTLSNALKAAALVSGLAGAGGGGGGASGASRPLGSIFSAQLPTTSKIATARQPFAVLPDMTRYGRGTPSLAAQVPQYGGVMPPGFNPETMEWLGPQKEEPEKMAWGGYAEGGIDGPGDGRSDSIPAQLSDGEYVIDAETVALLGNGSNKAGAKKLDQFRVNIRKSKGKHLAKGKFSVNAKKPESYLGAK